MKIFKHKFVTKKFALRAAAYRRAARSMLPRGQEKYTFSTMDLVELFLLESKGQGCSFHEMKARNGFAYGKWVRDLSVSMMVEDITRGDACKAEFLSSPIQRLHNEPVLRGVVAGTWFPFAAMRRATP